MDLVDVVDIAKMGLRLTSSSLFTSSSDRDGQELPETVTRFQRDAVYVEWVIRVICPTHC